MPSPPPRRRRPAAPARAADPEALQKELFDAKRAGDTEREIAALIALARCGEAEGDFGTANFHYDLAARVIRKSGHDLARLCDVLGERTLILRRWQRRDEALALAERAVDAARQHGSPLQQARWLGELGSLHRLLKRPDDARRAFEEARALAQSAGEAGRALLAQQEGNLGLLAREAGDDAAAEAAYRRAAELAEAAGDDEVFVTWENNLARALSRRRRYQAGWQHFSRALERARALGDDVRAADVAIDWARSLGAAHRFAEAARVQLACAEAVTAPRARAELLESALFHLSSAEDWRTVVTTGQALLALLQEYDAPSERTDPIAQQVDQASAQLRASESAPHRHRSGDATALDGYLVAAMAHYEETADADGMLEMARLICDIAIGLADPSEQGWRELMGEPPLRFQIVADAMKALIMAERPLVSLELAQRFKSIGFAAPNIERLSAAGCPHEEARQYLAAHERLATMVAGLKDAIPRDIPMRCHQVRAAGEDLLEAGEILRERDRVLHARVGGLVRPRDLLGSLPVNSPVAIVDLNVGRHGTCGHILYRSDNDVTVQPLYADGFTAERAVHLLRLWQENHVANELSQRQHEALIDISKELHDHLFCSLASHLAALHLTQVVLVPDLLLAPLPLHLAGVCEQNVTEIVAAIRMAEPPDEVQFFAEAFPVEYVPCLQAAMASQEQKSPRALSQVLALSDPVSNLPAARATGEWLVQRLADRVPVIAEHGARASKASLAAHFGSADVIVLSTHGHFDPAQPGRSRLVFADGDWTLAEILDQQSLARGPVVVLSACEIGASAVTLDPRETSGIPGALLSAGAAAVLAAQWPVEDVSAGFLVERFIHHLSQRGLRPAAALLRALYDLRRMPKDEALARCDRMLDALDAADASPSRAEQILMIDALRDWIDACDGPCPFTSPQVWGSFVLVGSGWHAPAGALVAGGNRTIAMLDAVSERLHAQQLIVEGQFATAKDALERLLPQLDGVERAAALDALAWATWNTRNPAAAASAERDADAFLDEAETIARADQEEQLLRNVAATRAKIALQKRRNHVETDLDRSSGASVPGQVPAAPARRAPAKQRGRRPLRR